MTDAFNAKNVMGEIESIVRGLATIHGKRLHDGILIVPLGSGVPLYIRVTHDVARIRTGYNLHLTIGNDYPGDDETLIEVIRALVTGNAEEYFSLKPGSVNGWQGYRVWYPRGARSASEAGRQTVAVRRLDPWTLPKP